MPQGVDFAALSHAFTASTACAGWCAFAALHTYPALISTYGRLPRELRVLWFIIRHHDTARRLPVIHYRGEQGGPGAADGCDDSTGGAAVPVDLLVRIAYVCRDVCANAPYILLRLLRTTFPPQDMTADQRSEWTEAGYKLIAEVSAWRNAFRLLAHARLLARWWECPRSFPTTSCHAVRTSTRHQCCQRLYKYAPHAFDLRRIPFAAL